MLSVMRAALWWWALLNSITIPVMQESNKITGLVKLMYHPKVKTNAVTIVKPNKLQAKANLLVKAIFLAF